MLKGKTALSHKDLFSSICELEFSSKVLPREKQNPSSFTPYAKATTENKQQQNIKRIAIK
jgi:hypothetical protein